MQPSFPQPIQTNPANSDAWGPPPQDPPPPNAWVPPQPQQSSLNYESNLSLNNNQHSPRPPFPQMPQMPQGIPSFDQGFAVPMENMLKNPMTAMGVEAGKQYLQTNMGGVFKWLSLNRLRYYFNVDNAYVLNKLKILICPLMHKNWKREEMHSGESMAMHAHAGPVYKPPRHDINAPDLYIPVMSFWTYTLVLGYAMGTFGEFTPDVMGYTATTAIFFLFLEVVVIKGGLFCLGCPTVPAMLDLAAYASYKYFGMIIEILVSLMFGDMVFYVACLFIGCSMGLFMMRTLKARTDTQSGQSIFSDATSKSTYFLLAIGVMQIILCYVMVYAARASVGVQTPNSMEDQWALQQLQLEKLELEKQQLERLKEEQNQQLLQQAEIRNQQ